MAQAAKDGRRRARDLVHARGHAEVGAALGQPHADAAGQVQGPALRRARARPTSSSRSSASRRRSCYTSFYWDNLIYFGMGPKKGPDGKLALTLPMGDEKLPGHRGGGHRRLRLRDLQGRAGSTSARRVGIAGEHLTGAEMAAALSKALGREVRYNAVSPGGLPRLRVPGRRRPREHVPVQPRLQRRVLPPRAASIFRGASIRGSRASKPGCPATRSASRSSEATV